MRFVLMKTILFVLLFCCTASLFSEKVIVLDVEDRTSDMKPIVLKGARTVLVEDLSKVSKYQVIPVNTVDTYLEKNKLGKCFDMECQVKLGKGVGADIVISSTVDTFAGISTLTILIVDVKNNKKMEGGAADFNGTAVGMKNALSQVVAKMHGKKFSPKKKALTNWEGYEKKYRQMDFEKTKTTYKIEPKKKAKTFIKPGSFSTVTVPSGALVVFDKNGISPKKCFAPCIMDKLVPGDYVVSYSLKGYDPVEEVVRIESGKKVSKSITLKQSVADKVKLNNELIDSAEKGQMRLVRVLLAKGADPNYHDQQGMSPLLISLLNKHYKVSNYLLKKGAKLTDVEGGTLLRIAVDTGDAKLLKKLIKQNADLNFRFEKGRTILWLVVEKSEWNLLKILMRAKIDKNIKDNNGQTVVMYVIKNGFIKATKKLRSHGFRLPKKEGVDLLQEAVGSENIDMISTLLSFNVNVNAEFEMGLNALWYAVLRGRSDIVEMLLKNGARASSKDQGGKSLLMHAIETRKFEIARLLYKNRARLSYSEKTYLLQKGVVIGDTELIRIIAKFGVNLNMKFKDGLSAIWIAAFNNNRDMIEELAKLGANLNIKDKKGRTVLMWAVENDRKDVATLLIMMKAKVNLMDNNKQTALFSAVSAENLPMVRMLVKNGAKLNLKDNNGDSPLIVAVAKGNRDIVDFLLDHNVFLNAKDRNGNTPLLIALFKGYHDIVIQLVERRANVDVANKDRMTPLIIAAIRGEEKLVKLFVKKGANLDRKDRTGATALLQAKRNNRRHIVHFLLEKNARIFSRKEADELMAYATYNSYRNIVQALIKKKVPVTRRFADGLTPFWYAVRNGDIKMMEILKDAGSDLEARNREGQTPLLYAAAKREEGIVLKLIEMGAEINVKDRRKNTPLILSAGRGYVTVVELLIKKGADLNDKDEHGRTAMTRAQFTGNYQIVDLLKRAGAYQQ